MSFLAGRLAAIEGAYFLQESKNAAGRLAKKLPSPSAGARVPQHRQEEPGGGADVLPEILRHSIPIKGTPLESDPSLSTSSKWLLPPSSGHRASPDAINPLRAYVSLPQATFGPRRWQLPNEQPAVSASTANDLRQDRYSHINSEKLKALAEGYSQIGKAFALATTVVFGGSAAAFVYTAHKLQMESADDIRTKGKDLIQPGADIMREQLIPIRAWADSMARRWHIEGGSGKEKSIVKELSKTLGARNSS
ncbi:Uncharacterized protein M6B38_242505 [Iris pallida]|uniref:Uncharacterized protein n=1 Tax=Iris pallida TaxID=29817 RepID=A0AAX6DJQ4_IRIPA|nr:Uncharacterized protein M6B38_242505 [Iris pallida]